MSPGPRFSSVSSGIVLGRLWPPIPRQCLCPAVGLGFQHSVSPKRGTTAHYFGPCLLWPNGRPSQLLLSTCHSWPPDCEIAVSWRTECRSKRHFCDQCQEVCSDVLRRLTDTSLCEPTGKVCTWSWQWLMAASVVSGVQESHGRPVAYQERFLLSSWGPSSVAQIVMGRLARMVLQLSSRERKRAKARLAVTLRLSSRRTELIRRGWKKHVYTVSQKTRHYNIVHNFAKCWPCSNFFHWQIH